MQPVNKSFVTSKQVTENLWAINSKTNKFTKLPKSDSDTYFSTFILCIGDTTLQLDVSLWLSIFYIFSRGKSYKYTLQKCHLSPFSVSCVTFVTHTTPRKYFTLFTVGFLFIHISLNLLEFSNAMRINYNCDTKLLPT